MIQLFPRFLVKRLNQSELVILIFGIEQIFEAKYLHSEKNGRCKRVNELRRSLKTNSQRKNCSRNNDTEACDQDRRQPFAKSKTANCTEKKS